MPRTEPYPPHLQRKIDEAQAKLARRNCAPDATIPKAAKRGVIASPETDKEPPPKRKPEPRRGVMNKLETAYELELRVRKIAREIEDYGFEEIKLRLADGAWFTPDFHVVRRSPSGLLTWEFHDTKGFMREAAMVRLKVARDRFRWASFWIVKADSQRGGGFTLRPV